MGPQLDSCGRGWAADFDPAAKALQWGRNLIVAEGVCLPPPPRLLVTLQWGRNLIVAEGEWRGLAAWRGAGFNGAAT